MTQDDHCSIANESDAALIARYKESLDSGAGTIVMHPDDIQRLAELGQIPLDRATFLSSSNEVKEYFAARLGAAITLIDLLPPVIDSTRPIIQQLYIEIRNCLLFAQHGAAITLCGILLEFTLKYVSYHWLTEESERAYDPIRWDSIVERKSFAGAIAMALKLAIISNDEASALSVFKTEIRNPYNHYNIKKLVKNVIFKRMTKANAAAITHVESNVSANSNPIFFSHAKLWHDEQIVSMVFQQTFSLVQVLLARLDAQQMVYHE